jgi:replication fork protection complex subunit Csm3/Swi3
MTRTGRVKQGVPSRFKPKLSGTKLKCAESLASEPPRYLIRYLSRVAELAWWATRLRILLFTLRGLRSIIISIRVQPPKRSLAPNMADTRTRDTVTSLLNYDVSDNEDDPFRDIDTTLHEPASKSNTTKRKATGTDNKENTDILGLDEEVKIVKKRKPIAKLDEAKLLSQPGIPKLRAIARSNSIASKLRLKGKGHEYSDAAKLLSHYQLWLDNLYPRAKFADGLQLVEKVGHRKRMQVMRKEWIDEGRPGYGKDVEDTHTLASAEGQNRRDGSDRVRSKSPVDRRPIAGPKTTAHESIFGHLDEGDDDDMFFNDPQFDSDADDHNANEPDEDELDALLAEQTATKDSRPQHRQTEPNEDNEDNEDDLDALMAEQAGTSHVDEPPQRDQLNPRPGEAAPDAMQAEDITVPHHDPEPTTQPEHDDFPANDDDDELEALLAAHAASSP